MLYICKISNKFDLNQATSVFSYNVIKAHLHYRRFFVKTAGDTVFALATLGNATQIESFLFCIRRPMQVQW
jgi:hypothetical protein